MNFDLSFEEAIDILKNKLGWVQGENFDQHEYLAMDRLRSVYIKNIVDDRQIGCVFDFLGNQTKKVWIEIMSIPEEMKAQKYRFILVLNRDSVKGVGGYTNGHSREVYLSYKALHKHKR